MIRFWFCTLGDQEKALLKKELCIPLQMECSMVKDALNLLLQQRPFSKEH